MGTVHLMENLGIRGVKLTTRYSEAASILRILNSNSSLYNKSSNFKLATNKKLRFSVVDLTPTITYTAFSKIIKAILTIVMVEFSRECHHSAVKWLCPQKFGSVLSTGKF